MDPQARTTLSDLLNLTAGYALDRLTDPDLPVAAEADLATLRRQIDRPLNQLGIDAAEVIHSLVAAVQHGLIDAAGPRFFGWVIGGAVPAALAADWLTSAWDQNAALYATAPAAAVAEETAGRWLKDLLQLPLGASFALVTGCQMAHLTCLAAARHHLLAQRGWNVEELGLSGAPALRVLTSTEKHGSINRAVRLLGIGEANIHTLPVDGEGRLLASALEGALAAEPLRPTVVVLQAGDLNIGAFDDFYTLIPLAKKYGAWTHIDGAFGLWAAATPTHRHLMRGAEQADSWATDGHKWLNVPYDCGYSFVAQSQAHRASMSHRAAYLTHDADARDQMDWNPEWSRRARGFATYAALRELGREGVAGLITRTCTHAQSLIHGIGAIEGAEIVHPGQINQGLVRFLHPSQAAGEADHDRFTGQVTAAILADGQAFFTNTTWRGRRAMRISVCNWQTSQADVDRVLRSVGQVLRQQRQTIV